MKVTKDVIEYVAHLGRLELDPDEIDRYTSQLDSILEYMDKLNSLDTSGVEPTTHAIPNVNVFREDQVVESFSVEASVGNAPERKGSFFKVPPIIEAE
ncbi:MAG TPA: Asp-tRNA(Asn)/Glu-tRNA(Gln) amidotransferase subunit GatC [Syntrophorhabdales bacterium]|nr:Asp-tRNA(Asn)/Glu-tRNA(Gln) amidotransferase subunit GatC [Syntrophorhabdales bacterium]